MGCLITIGEFVACMCIWALKVCSISEHIGDVVRVYASLDACCEDSECYIPSGLF